jgi:hypothetical protein
VWFFLQGREMLQIYITSMAMGGRGITETRNIFTHCQINGNVAVAKVIPKVMSTLSAIKWSCEVVQKGKSVSTTAFSLIGNNSLYNLSAKEAVFMVPTLGPKSTNTQFIEFHKPFGQKYNSSLLVWRQHDMWLQAVTPLLG